MNRDILLIDSDEAFNNVLKQALSQRGFHVLSATSLQQGLAYAKEFSPHFTLLDINLDGHTSLKPIPSILELSPETKILVLTNYASITSAVQAVKLGAWDYLAKPTSLDIIFNTINGIGKTKPSNTTGSFMSVRRMEWEYIQRVLSVHKGNIAATARALNMHRRTLQRKLVKRPPSV
jgi:two-component system response regulator RegA